MSYQPTIGQGANDVAVAGTQEALVASATFVSSVSIQARRGNTGNVFIGTSDITNDGLSGIELAPGEIFTFLPPPDGNGRRANFNLAVFFVDAATAGDGVTFVYSQDSFNQHTF
jgi:hypothetical protein